jgi:serine protease
MPNLFFPARGAAARCGILLGALALALASFSAGAADGPDPDRYIVKFHAGKVPHGLAVLRGASAEVLVELGPQDAVAARIPPQALKGLQHHPSIEYIERDPPRYPMAETVPYGITMVQADSASGLMPGASTRKVCVIDSGYDLGHEDLPGTARVSGLGTTGWDTDGCGHGTHVAGTIAALGGNGKGVVGVIGGDRVHVYNVKVFGDNCKWSYASNTLDAANQCEKVGANVINMSLGCTSSGGGPFGCSSSTESNGFKALYDKGILLVAAAGNDGSTRKSYPASYDSVISVAAVDSAKVVASFSQKNDAVELAAPGVAVRSTVPRNTGKNESLAVAGTGYEAIAMEGSPDLTRTGNLFNCGAATSACTGATGATCLIERGTNTFAEKVLNCQAGGGVAAVIYNNADGLFSGTMGTTATLIPSVGISRADGITLRGSTASATVAVSPGHYAYFDGTSMATPHVAGVAALIWTHNPAWSNVQIRQALRDSAEDLGAAGKDNSYGFGLVRAAAAKDLLAGSSGGGGGGGGDDGSGGSCTLGAVGASCSVAGDCCSNKCAGKTGAKTCK